MNICLIQFVPRCAAGFYASSGGTYACSSCALGTYSPLIGATFCKPCPTGLFGGISSLTACIECTAGYYSVSSGSKSCTACASGQYGNTLRPCVLCAPGTYSGAGASACSTCATGKFASGGSSECGASCPPGYYTTSESSLCIECPSGQFQPASAAGCLACAPGQFTSSYGSAYCMSCQQIGAYSAVAGSSACVKCARGMYSAVYSTACSSNQAVGVKSQGGLMAAVKIPGNIINFLADIRLTHTIVVSESVVIFGNGYKLDGQNAVQCLYITSGSTVEISCHITGLTITGGAAINNDNSINSDIGGGGVFVSGARLQMTSCNIVSNTATGQRSYGGGNGGGIYVENGDLKLTSCYIGNNAIILEISDDRAYNDHYNYYGGNSDFGSGGGGGIYLRSGSLLMTGCYLISNTATKGGGLYVFDSSPVSMIGCSLSINSATQFGDDVYFGNGKGNLATLAACASNFYSAVSTSFIRCHGCSSLYEQDLSPATCSACPIGKYSCCGATSCSSDENACGHNCPQ